MALILTLIGMSCTKTDETSNDETKSFDLVFDEAKAIARNQSDLEILENCGIGLTAEGVSCCSVLPDTVEIGGVYIAGAKFMINDGNSPAYEPEDVTYQWNIDGEGIRVSKTDGQLIAIQIESGFTGGSIQSLWVADDGGCSAASELVLRKQ